VVDKLTPWDGGYVGINSFGFGGSNVHVLLRSASQTESAMQHAACAVPRLVAVCGRTKESVEKTLGEALQRPCDVELHTLLQTSVGEQLPSVHPYRGFAIVNAPSSRQTVEVCSEFKSGCCLFIGSTKSMRQVFDLGS
jgi:fatty acid synthase, animal type